MSAENIGGISISCSHLEEQGVEILDNYVVVDFKGVTSATELDDLEATKNLPGTCTTGQRGECPLRLNCGEVKLTTSVPPLFFEVTPTTPNK